MKSNRFLKVLFLLLLSLFTIVSCKNSGNNAPETFMLETTATPSNAGTVTPLQGSFEADEQVQITASANENWIFKEWNGDFSGTENPATVTISQDMNINALFEELTHPLTVEMEGNGQVQEDIVNAKTDYVQGTTVQLTAVPDEHWEFKEWQDDLTGTTNPETITMDQAKTVTAVFEEKTYPLNIIVEGEGEVSEEVVNAKNYTFGTVVELTAMPTEEWRFSGWTGDLESTENPATITVDGEKTVHTIFDFGFNEDFEDGTADNWIFSGDQFSVEDGKLQFYTDDGDDDWGSAYYDQMFTDFKVEMNVARMKSEDVLYTSMTLFIRSNGFLTYADNSSTGYEININQNGEGSVWKIEDGVETNIIPWVPVDDLNEGLGNYNVITVNVNGSRFDIYVNGEHYIGFSDDSFSEGYIGIATYTYENEENQVFWEYVKVTPADQAKAQKETMSLTPDLTSGNSAAGSGSASVNF